MTASVEQAGAALSSETYLPSDGADVGPEYMTLVQPFVDAGLVRLEPYDVVYCAEVEDDSDDRDPWCDAWIEPDGDGEHECLECGHLIWPEPHQVRQRFRARVEREVIEAWLEELVAREGELERLRGGCAWRLTVEGEEIVVAVLDWSEDTRWVDAGRMDVDPTLLILVEPARYRTRLREGVVAVELLDLVLGCDLGPFWQILRESTIAFDRPRAWMPSHTLPNRYHCRKLGAHLLETVDDGVRVDGVEVERTGGAYPYLRLLVKRHADDVADGKQADGHCWWSAQELADEVAGGVGSREQVKRALSRFVRELSEVYQQETGRPLGLDAVIESSRAGYRVNPAVYGRLA